VVQGKLLINPNCRHYFTTVVNSICLLFCLL